jgi:hypothetical protein
MVEGVNEPESLVEERLCLRVAGGRWMMQVAKAVHELGGLGLRSHVVLRHSRGRSQHGKQKSA